jgi:hypothetical protein
MFTRALFLLATVSTVFSATACVESDEPSIAMSDAIGKADFGTDGDGTEVWRAVRQCEAAVVDHNDGPCNSDHCQSGTLLDYQLVVRDSAVIEYLNDVGVWPSAFGADEIIIQGWNWPGSGPDNIRFRKIVSCAPPSNDCRWVDVFDDWGGIKASFVHRTTTCTDLDPAQGCLGEWKTEEAEEANWWFGNCRR